MSKYVIFDRDQFGSEGLIPLKRGDDWSLRGKIVDLKGTFKDKVNLTGFSATGFFPGTNDSLSQVVEIVCAEEGTFRIDIPASASINAALANNGTTMYITISNTDGKTETVETEEEVLEVRDREFRTF